MTEIKYGSWGDELEKENVEYEKKNRDNITIEAVSDKLHYDYIKLTTQPSASESPAGFTLIKKDDDSIAEVYGSDKEAQELATLFALAPELLKGYKDLRGRVSKMAMAMRRNDLGDWVNDWLSDGILDGDAIVKAERRIK